MRIETAPFWGCFSLPTVPFLQASLSAQCCPNHDFNRSHAIVCSRIPNIPFGNHALATSIGLPHLHDRKQTTLPNTPSGRRLPNGSV
jgi:hypothetical protein